MNAVQIQAVNQLPDLSELAKCAEAEGFNFLLRLQTEWQDGSNRFDKPGEIFLITTKRGQVVATAGLTRQTETIGRVRRVYVHPDYRRQGIAKALLAEIIVKARTQFEELVLFTDTDTDTDTAAHLYESLGFKKESQANEDNATHRLRL